MKKQDFTREEVIKLKHVCESESENHYNALLISKAPEMLQALITTLEELEDIDVLENHRNYIEQLIKQATGL